MSLAQIVTKYAEKINWSSEAVDVLDAFTSIVSPKDYSEILKLFSGMGETELSKLGGKELTLLLFSGFFKNRISTLVGYYMKVGNL